MLKLAAGENLNNDIVRGVRRRLPEVDFARIQDHGLSGASDERVLAWAAEVERVLVTHDVSTMTPKAAARLEQGKSMPGVFQVARSVSIGQAIEDLVLIAECSVEGEWEGQVRYLPL